MVGSVGRTFFLNKFFLVYVHLSYNYYEIGFCSKGLLIVYGLGYYVMFSFINEMFNFSINDVVGKTIINKGLFYIFKFVKEDSLRGR